MQTERIIILFIAAVAGCFAAMMAFLISYQEYLRHFPDKSRARLMALQSALFTFLFFVVIGLVLMLVLPRVL